MAFIVWFVVSALVVRLPAIGFKLTTSQLFWLAAMPGLAGGTLRIIHTFLMPLYGTRNVVTLSTLSLLIPAVGWFYAVQDPTTPYLGADAARLPRRPRRRQLLVLHAVDQPVLPEAAAGHGARDPGRHRQFRRQRRPVRHALDHRLRARRLAARRAADAHQGDGATAPIWLQNATAIYVPFIVVFGIAAWLMLRSVPVRANFREQLDIFKEKHGFYMTLLYIMTFGSFSGLSATFPLLIKQIYGALRRRARSADLRLPRTAGRLGGAHPRRAALRPARRRPRHPLVRRSACWSAALAVTFFTAPTSMDAVPVLRRARCSALFFFAGIGNASTFKQMPMIFPPRQAGGVIGWTGAMAAYGPFAVGLMLGYSFDWFGSFNAVLLLGGVLLPRLHRHQLVVLRPQGRGEAVLIAMRRQLCRESPRHQ